MILVYLPSTDGMSYWHGGFAVTVVKMTVRDIRGRGCGPYLLGHQFSENSVGPVQGGRWQVRRWKLR